jgi:hypothetical protein
MYYIAVCAVQICNERAMQQHRKAMQQIFGVDHLI